VKEGRIGWWADVLTNLGRIGAFQHLRFAGLPVVPVHCVTCIFQLPGDLLITANKPHLYPVLVRGLGWPWRYFASGRSGTTMRCRHSAHRLELISCAIMDVGLVH
jgi:hypothetical protein